MSGRYDALFKRAFSQPENAAALARCSLSSEMQAIFDWSSIRRLPGSFVNSGLRERHTDLLFQVQTTLGVVLIYILLEHQSGDDRRMPLRSACYMDRIWEAFDREHPAGPLPVILPLVISHSPNGWTAPRSFHELFDPQVLEFGPPLMRHVPSFDLIIDDLSRTSDDDLASRSLANFAKVVLWLLRDGRSQRLLDRMPRWAKLLQGLPGDSLEAVVSYLTSLFEDDELTWEKFRARLHTLAPEAEGEIMTLTEKWFQQGETKGREEGLEEGLQKGLQQGREQGLEKGRVEMLAKLLTLKFGELSEAAQARLASAGSGEIEQWIERVLFAGTLEQVLDESPS